MSFVNLSLLAGAAFIAVPVVLHLIMRQKPRLFEFPALRLIQKRHDANRRRLRLRQLLLLLLRAAAIALLAFALARPSVHFGGSLGSQKAPVAAVLLFDTAPRMDYRQDNRTRLEAARELGLWLLTQLPPESQIGVLDARLASAAFQVDRGAARDRIHKLETAAGAQPLTVAVEEALRLAARSELRQKEIYVFTDLSAAAWPPDGAARLQDRITDLPGAAIYVIDVGVERPSNFALGELRLSGQVLSQRGGLVLRAAISAVGASGRRNVDLYLRDELGAMVQRDAATVALDDGASEEIEFRVGSLEPGTHQGVLRIVGQDALPADDARYFTVEVKPPWRVLLAAPDPPDRYAIYLAEALSPTEFRKRGQARFDCDVVALGELAQTALGPYSAVFLLDPEPLESAVWQKLGDYVSGGGGLGVFLGRRADPVDSFNTPAAQELLPGRLLRQARRPDGDLYLAPQDYAHPVLAAMRPRAGGIPWSMFPVFRYWEFDRLAAGAGVIVPLSDGRPALVERPLGSGRALTMSTPVSDDPNRQPWNLLPVGEAWPFVILAHQIASYLVGSTEEQFNYYAGQTAALRLGADDARRTFLLTTPGGMSFPLSADPKQAVLTITATEEVGNYRVRAGGTESGVDRGFSVNLAPEQTSLRRIAKEELRELFGPFQIDVARTRDEIDRNVSMGRVGRELFSAVILLLAGVLVAELFVSNRFYGE